jgi:hypothetical protein
VRQFRSGAPSSGARDAGGGRHGRAERPHEDHLPTVPDSVPPPVLAEAEEVQWPGTRRRRCADSIRSRRRWAPIASPDGRADGESPGTLIPRMGVRPMCRRDQSRRSLRRSSRALTTDVSQKDIAAER